MADSTDEISRAASTNSSLKSRFGPTFAERHAEKLRKGRSQFLDEDEELHEPHCPEGTMSAAPQGLNRESAVTSTQNACAEKNVTGPTSTATLSGKEFTKEEAGKVVNLILGGKAGETAYQLIPFPEYQARLRGGLGRLPRETRALDGFLALCPTNSLQRTGIVVCKFAIGGACPLEKAIFRYSPASGGTSTFKSHTEYHTKRSSQKTLDTIIPLATRRIIASGAALAVTQDLLPFDFMNGPGMKAFALACFNAGQASSAMQSVDISKALPAPGTVKKTVEEQAIGVRKSFMTQNYPNSLCFGGAVTTDGLKHKPTGSKFYDLSMMYFEVIGEGTIQGPRLQLISRVLLLEEHTSHQETADAISATLADGLREKYDIELSDLLQKFTMVTDRASTLPCVAGASSSSAKCPYGEKWSPCMPHYLNTIMKYSIEMCKSSEVVSLNRISQDLSRAKEIVRVFKAGDWQKELGNGKKLIQEVETRFATTYSVVERFLGTIGDIERIVFSSEHRHMGARGSFEGIDVARCPDTDAVVEAPALRAITETFESIVTVQKQLEADLSPTIHLVLPYLELILAQLGRLFSPTSNATDFTKSLARVTHTQILTMKEHPFHPAACLLVPSLRNLEFIQDITKRERVRGSGLAQIRRLMAKTSARKMKKGANIARDSHENPNSEIDTTLLKHTSPMPENSVSALTPAKRKRGCFLSLRTISDSGEGQKQREDELALYFASSVPVEYFREHFDVDDPMAAPTFWLRQRAVYPELYEVAMRLFATPASSCTSERVFSVVSRTLTPDRSRMTSQNLSNIVIVRSALSHGVKPSSEIRD